MCSDDETCRCVVRDERTKCTAGSHSWRWCSVCAILQRKTHANNPSCIGDQSDSFESIVHRDKSMDGVWSNDCHRILLRFPWRIVWKAPRERSTCLIHSEIIIHTMQPCVFAHTLRSESISQPNSSTKERVWTSGFYVKLSCSVVTHYARVVGGSAISVPRKSDHWPGQSTNI